MKSPRTRKMRLQKARDLLVRNPDLTEVDAALSSPIKPTSNRTQKTETERTSMSSSSTEDSEDVLLLADEERATVVASITPKASNKKELLASPTPSIPTSLRSSLKRSQSAGEPSSPSSRVSLMMHPELPKHLVTSRYENETTPVVSSPVIQQSDSSQLLSPGTQQKSKAFLEKEAEEQEQQSPLRVLRRSPSKAVTSPRRSPALKKATLGIPRSSLRSSSSKRRLQKAKSAALEEASIVTPKRSNSLNSMSRHMEDSSPSKRTSSSKVPSSPSPKRTASLESPLSTSSRERPPSRRDQHRSSAARNASRSGSPLKPTRKESIESLVLRQQRRTKSLDSPVRPHSPHGSPLKPTRKESV
ncbi:MAG: hypothetical protein SGARI_000660, partial [Bacillariaceae sp.]